ncbi:stress-response A/B barrel domain-containing protein UP3-like [Actinidia eriantha]|uniref:stress-response A/B barrel domain-containing protein UP3-like n=1 Tax=Actinidia eriantha TaxID=165200 RepID=UPI00258D7823|nr:stress-response A/B barrel domain-containing protein UP3-like [Actinidia eriantha]
MVTKLCLRSRTLLLSPPTTHSLTPPTLTPLLPHSHRYSSPIFPIKMSAQIVEHIVLFKVKPDTDPSKADSMVNALNGLRSLDQVLHLTVGPLHRIRSSPFAFTHMLHSRYRSKDDLDAYSGHPAHVGVVAASVRPICEDIMAVDWTAETGPVEPAPGSAMRLNILKLKEGLGDSERKELLGVIGGIKDRFPAIDQISVGENFSPARAKGFSICSIAFLPRLSELEALDSDSNSELVESEKSKFRGMLESVMVLDYVIPQLQGASL